jgi:hydrogenase-4 component F
MFVAPNRKRIFGLTAVFLGAQALFLVHAILNRNSTELGCFKYDSLGILFFGTLALVSIAVFLHSPQYLNKENIRKLRYYNIAFIALCVVVGSAYFASNVTVTWVLIEATTITAAMLIYHRRTPRALEAAWKYVFICSIGILIAYLGILFLSIMLKNHHGNMSFDSLATAIQTADPLYLKLAFVLVITGYSCKMEFFPLYPISIDANHVTPTPMSALMSTAVVNMGFIAIFRIYSLFIGTPVFVWAQNVMLVTGMVTLLVATVYIIQVQHCKRLFAYSTVENTGFVLLLLSIGKTGMAYAIFHILMHSLVKSAAFLQLAHVGRTFGSYRTANIGNYLKVSKTGSIILILCLFGLTAIPPSALFISEMFVVSELSRNSLIAIFLVLMICIILYFLCFKFLRILYGKPPDSEISPSPDKLTAAVRCILLGLFFFLGIYQPQWFMKIIFEIISG